MNRSEYRKKRKEIRQTLENNSRLFQKLSVEGQYNFVTETMNTLGYTMKKKWIAIDAELHKQLKTQTASEGKQIKEVVEALIHDYLEKGGVKESIKEP